MVFAMARNDFHKHSGAGHNLGTMNMSRSFLQEVNDGVDSAIKSATETVDDAVKSVSGGIDDALKGNDPKQEPSGSHCTCKGPCSCS
jgi:hypothetical protein